MANKAQVSSVPSVGYVVRYCKGSVTTRSNGRRTNIIRRIRLLFDTREATGMKRICHNGIFAVCCVIALYVALHLIGITCPIKYLTGISCPGCGMSRAYICLLRLDIRGAAARSDVAVIRNHEALQMMFPGKPVYIADHF